MSCFLTLDMAVAQQTDKKPNILVIFGDDVGMWNVAGMIQHDESDLTGLRVGDWKMSFAVKEDGLWWDPLVYPRVPYLFNLRMDPMELFDPHSSEWGYMARKLFVEKLWTLIPAQGLIAAHIKSLQEWPPRQRAQSLSLQKAMEAAMQSLGRAPSGMQ